MGLLETIAARHRALTGRDLDRVTQAWPVGRGSLTGFESTLGHDQSTFSPAEYGDYLATSNEIYAAASLRARLMSGLTLRLYIGQEASKQEVTRGRAHRLLHYVNPYWSPRRLARMDELAMCIYGQTFWALERGRSREPEEIWWCRPDRMRPVPDERGYLRGYLYEPIAGGEPIRFEPHEIIWFRYPNPLDEFSPLSPLAAARLAADTARAMMKSNRKLFSDGLQLGGLIMPRSDQVMFGERQAEELEEALERRWSRADRRHRWAVLRFEAQFKELGVSPKDAEFVQGLSLTARQVWNAYGIPAPLLNDLAHATLANVREFERALWENALKPDAQLRSDEISEQVLPLFRGRGEPDHAEYDFTQVAALQESASEAWGREGQQIERGALTINEWRRSKGLAPVPWGDVWWAPVNKSAVTDATSQPQGDTSPSTLPTDDDSSDDAGQQAVPVSPAVLARAPEAAAGELTKAEVTRFLDEVFRSNGTRVGAGS